MVDGGRLAFAAEDHALAVPVPGEHAALEGSFQALALAGDRALGCEQHGLEPQPLERDVVAKHVIGQQLDRRGIAVKVLGLEPDELRDVCGKRLLSHVKGREQQLAVDRVGLPVDVLAEPGEARAPERSPAATGRVAHASPHPVDERHLGRRRGVVEVEPELVARGPSGRALPVGDAGRDRGEGSGRNLLDRLLVDEGEGLQRLERTQAVHGRPQRLVCRHLLAGEREHAPELPFLIRERLRTAHAIDRRPPTQGAAVVPSRR